MASKTLHNLGYGSVLTIDGKDWQVLAVGTRTACRVYVHIASIQEGVHQKNGFRPLQKCGWWDGETLHQCCECDVTPPHGRA